MLGLTLFKNLTISIGLYLITQIFSILKIRIISIIFFFFLLNFHLLNKNDFSISKKNKSKKKVPEISVSKYLDLEYTSV